MVKRVRRLVSGQCAIARICGEPKDAAAEVAPHTPDMTQALLSEWKQSSKLNALFEEFSKQPDMTVINAISTICTVKNISPMNPCVDNLRQCVYDIKCVNDILDAMHARVNETFDVQNEEHEQALENLWQHLLPGVERAGGRHSKDWGRIGFQQSDPASDFRGGGALALDQLVYIAVHRTAVAQRMITEPTEEMSRYPWACVGINLTREIVRVAEARMLDRRLFGKDVNDGLAVLHAVYADMFEVLHRRWVDAKPENVLAFPHLFKGVMTDIDKELAETGVIVPPGTEG